MKLWSKYLQHIGKQRIRLYKASLKSIQRCKNDSSGASLVAQWLRICLPMQGTRVRALVWEDPT